jgi:hypothetical protein
VNGESAAVFPAHRALVLSTAEAGDATAWYEPWPAQDVGHGHRLIALDGSWPQEALVQVAGPRVFGNGIELQGYAWSSNSEAGRLWLLWQVLWLSQEDTHFSTQLVDAEGQTRAQRDTEGYPTAFRQKGDRVISLFDINMENASSTEPAGIRVGLYTYPDIVAVPVIDGAGNPVGADVNLDVWGRGP